MKLTLTRRAFLALTGWSAVARPALACSIRDPFVVAGESVDSIIWHLWDDTRNPAPTGPLFVHEIHPWDGQGYPITLMRCGWRVDDRTFFKGFHDFEWSNLRRDVPDRFWRDPAKIQRYPNVHSYVREIRFGEHPDVMRKCMEFNRLHPLDQQQAGRRALSERGGQK